MHHVVLEVLPGGQSKTLRLLNEYTVRLPLPPRTPLVLYSEGGGGTHVIGCYASWSRLEEPATWWVDRRLRPKTVCASEPRRLFRVYPIPYIKLYPVPYTPIPRRLLTGGCFQCVETAARLDLEHRSIPEPLEAYIVNS